MWKEISGKQLCKILIFRFFTSDIINALINILLPVIISVHCTNFEDKSSWWIPTIILCVLIVIFNIASIIIKNIENKENRNLNIIYKCYNEHRSINEKFTVNIYRLNKSINGCILDNKPITKKAFDKLADFQTYSFSICESIHKTLTDEYGSDIKCQVTVMKKDQTYIKMIAYSNNDHQQPSSYSKLFTLNDSDIYFISLFKDLNSEIACLPNQERVTHQFKKLQGSEKREELICQYIGIPIKTLRNDIELLLQIDVSKENILGKDEKQMKLFAKNVLYPYAVLLHKAYERDLIFTQYYDMIVSMLSNSQPQP